MSLIAADNDFAMWAVMLLLVALVFRLEKTTIGQKIPATIPHNNDSIFTYLVLST